MFDVTTQRWTDVDVDAAGSITRDRLTLSTFNIWFDSYFAEQRFHAISDLLSRNMPDVMVFQEVTPAALAVFLAQPWIREHYLRAAVTGGDRGNYGMMLLSRLPLGNVTYTTLPTRLARGFLTAELTVNGSPVVVCSIHLESGKRNVRLRGWQLRRIFRALRKAETAFVLGDFNMRDHENGRIDTAYCDLWPTLRPGADGYTEDTAINLMRWDSKPKHRQVRFDRILFKSTSWMGEHIELLGIEPISPAHPRVYPSDHFGVGCRLSAAFSAR